MGLDMYLSARISLGKYSKEELVKIGENIRKLLPDIYKSGNLDDLEVKFEVGYWRKANAIHKWFVDNCQDGKDECNPSYVSRKNLEKLKEICKEILNILNKEKLIKKTIKDRFTEKDIEVETYSDEIIEKIEYLLPTKSGFFFGGTEYDEWYKSDLEQTIEIINKCLKLPEEWTFEYQSSW